MLDDLRYALRGLRKAPLFSAAVIATLAAGIGGNTAMFAVIHRVLLQNLPYPDADRIVWIARTGGGTLNEPTYAFLARHNPGFEDLAAYRAAPGMTLRGSGRPEAVNALVVSRSYFALLGASPILGRVFTGAEDAPGGPRVLVMSYGLWQQRFGGDPSVLGRSVTLGGAPYTLVGVLAPAFQPYPAADLWVPLRADWNSSNLASVLTVAARLPAGVTLAEAYAELQEVKDRYNQTRARPFERAQTFHIAPLRQQITGDVRPGLLILLGAVGLVLLIACANIANLLLARGAARRKEIAIRAAMGAGRPRLMRQLLTESLLLALAGGAAGLLLGAWGVRALLAFAPADLPRLPEMAASPALDGRIAAFAFLLALGTGLLFGLLPALQLSHAALTAEMQDSTARSGSSRKQSRTRAALVLAEVSLAVVLLCGAVLLLRSFAALRGVEPGFDARNLLALEVSFAGSGDSNTASVDRLQREIIERAGRVPGVESAAVASALPLQGRMDMLFDIPGRTPPARGRVAADVQWRFVSANYFQVMRIPLRAGRLFRDQESRRVTLISEAMARKFWPGQNPVGQAIFIGASLPPSYQAGLAQIIGVVAGERERVELEPQPVIYEPFAQIPDAAMKLVTGYEPAAVLVRARPGAAFPRLERAMEEQLRREQLAPLQTRTMEQVARDATSRRKFSLLLLGLFAAMALLLAAVGIYSVMSYTVARRAREMGIRAALGATPPEIVTLVLKQALPNAVAGIAAGLAAALWLAQVLRAQLFQVKPGDPLAFTAAALILLLVAVAAAFVPAWRAGRADPTIALRQE